MPYGIYERSNEWKKQRYTNTWKENISKSLKGRKITWVSKLRKPKRDSSKMGHKKGNPSPNKGIKITEEQKIKISNSLKGHKYPEIRNKKIGLAHKGKCFLSDKAKQKIGLNNSKKLKEYYVKNPYAIERLRKQRLNQKLPFSDTSIEKITEHQLQKLNIEYKHPFNFADRFQCDFALVSEKIIIECDGDYWHSLPNMKLRDKRKDAYIKKCGWRIVRIPEKIINSKNFNIEEILNANGVRNIMRFSDGYMLSERALSEQALNFNKIEEAT